MRKTTFYFLYIEALDIITTVVGFEKGLWEINPVVNHIGLAGLILLKVILVIVVAIILEKKNAFWFDGLVLFIALLPVIWNAFNFLLLFPIIWHFFNSFANMLISKITP